MASQTQAFCHGGRRLFELLDEQQEPYLLEIYLLENGYSCGLFKSHTAMNFWSIYACRKMMGFTSHGVKRRGGGLLNCGITNFLPWKLIRKALNWDSKALNIGRKKILSCFPGMGGDDITTWFNRLSPPGEEDLDAKRLWKRMHKSKKLSPVPVPELHSSNSEMPEVLLHSSCISNFYQKTESSKALLRTKELILQYIKESEEMGQGQLLSLEKLRSDVAGIAKLIDGDLCKSKWDWNHFQDKTREIGLEIERFILEEIREEAVVEMLGPHCPLDRK